MPAYYQPNTELIDLANRAAATVGIRSSKGLIVSGDSFMSNYEIVKQLKQRFPDAQCAEMEAGSIAQVCCQFAVPFVIIRSLSDIAGQDAKLSYDQFLEKASLHSAKLVLAILKACKR